MIRSFLIFILVTGLCIGVPSTGWADLEPSLGLRIDEGFPVWLTPDPMNYLPLRTNQTSGLDCLGNVNNFSGLDPDYDWLLSVDDADKGGIHVIGVSKQNPTSVIFLPNDLTFPPPQVIDFPVGPGNGYDWEAIAIHQSGTVFLAHEGNLNEIGLWAASLKTYVACDVSSGMSELPDYLYNLRRVELPGWDQVFGVKFSDNLGIEGLACYGDMLYAGLESSYAFSDRLMGEMSTTLGIWKINPENPLDMESCELLAVHDTADWKSSLGFTVETICGLAAIDSRRIIGIDRDNTRLFTAEFSDSGELIGGRILWLDVPGPGVLPEDDCGNADYQPRLVKPSLESVAAVPGDTDPLTGVMNYRIYLACDPWDVGWRLLDQSWVCDVYVNRLNALLPAIYRYTVPDDVLFPD